MSMLKIKFLNILSVFLVFVLAINMVAQAHAVALTEHPKLRAIADELIAEKYYSEPELISVFDNATVQQSVLDAIKNPAEYKLTWGKYRKIFLQDDRIQQGVDFWREYRADLVRAEQQYGVPASVIVAIIGVESKFGKYKGKHKVLDSLVSLVVGYPRRSAFFAKELKQFLILTKENKLDSGVILGSYAGAVGYPQFISSSYRSYAVDFSGDGRIDLIDQPVDAIGSIANYFIENGWKPGEPVTSVAHLRVDDQVAVLANRKRKVQYSAQDLRAKGANIPASINDVERLGVLMLNASEIVSEPRSSNIYVVRAGDTACQIAERFSVPCKVLFSLNNLNSQGSIYRGQRLKLPPEKPVQTGKWSVNASADDLPENTEQPRWFYTHRNFYAITKYNHSVLYAMAVHDLSIAIEAKMREAN